MRDNNVEQALKVLKKKMQREGVFREMKRRKAYEKPSERKTREKAEAIRRVRKAARKQAQRDGLIPMPKRREDARRSIARPVNLKTAKALGLTVPLGRAADGINGALSHEAARILRSISWHSSRCSRAGSVPQ